MCFFSILIKWFQPIWFFWWKRWLLEAPLRVWMRRKLKRVWNLENLDFMNSVISFFCLSFWSEKTCHHCFNFGLKTEIILLDEWLQVKIRRTILRLWFLEELHQRAYHSWLPMICNWCWIIQTGSLSWWMENWLPILFQPVCWAILSC